MPPQTNPPDQVEMARASLQLAFSVLAKVGLLALAVVLAALFGGLWLDRQFDTRPLFTVLLMVASFPATMFIIYRVALDAVARMPRPPAGAPHVKEEHERDDDP